MMNWNVRHFLIFSILWVFGDKLESSTQTASDQSNGRRFPVQHHICLFGGFFTTSFTLVTARKIQQPFANQSLNTHFHQATACMKAGCEQPLSAGWRIISSTQLQCPFCVRLQKSRGALPSEVSQNSVLLCNRAVKRTKIKNYFRM